MTDKYKAMVEAEIDGEYVYLTVTRDGRQWTGVSIKKPMIEIPLIITALQDYLKKNNNAT